MKVSSLILVLSITVGHASAFSPSVLSSYLPTNLQTKAARPNRNTSLNAEDICILGGGFGGLNAALTLSSLPWDEDDKPTITLVDKKERFVFLPLLYELCVGDAELNEVAPTFTDLLQGTNIQFRQANIQGIDIDNDTVYIDNEAKASGSSSKPSSKIHYDSLIVATGADVNLKSIPGAESCALPFSTIGDCLELRKRLTLLDSIGEDLESEIDVVIVGGGYSGVELALNLKERLGDVGKGAKVTLVHRGSEVLEYATEYNRKTGIERLEKAKIDIVTGTSVTEVTANTSNADKGASELKNRCTVTVERSSKDGETKSKDSLNADILLWTAGAMSTNTQRGILNSNIPRDSSGRIVTNQFLAVKGTDNVFALGDCARVKKIPYGATAAVAMQQAPFAAWNVYASLLSSTSSGAKNQDKEKLKPLPFSYLDLGEMLTLGGEDATISSMGLVEVSGSAASVLRRLIYAVRMPTSQQALTAAISSTNKRFESILLSKGKDVPKKKIINWQ